MTVHEPSQGRGDAPPGTRVTLVRAFSKKGVGSRQQARDWILNGRVSVNGQIEKFLYAWVDLDQDVIALDGQPVGKSPEKIYLLFHKPAGYLTTRMDQKNRKTIYDLLPAFASWVFPVGRLDMDSEGALFLTNDGPMGEWLIHPDSHVSKIYHVCLDRPLQESHRLHLEAGVDLDDCRTKPAHVTPLESNDNSIWVAIQISEGKNRQVRRMFAAFGYQVIRLIRMQIGPLLLGELGPGEWRLLTADELAILENMRPKI